MTYAWEKLKAAFANRARTKDIARGPDVETKATPPLLTAASHIERDMDDALRAGEIFLAYQPKLCLRSGTITGVEALARWNHRRLGYIPPDQFVAHMERTGRICDLTLWVLARALADHGRLREQGFDLTVYINVSSLLLGDSNFVQAVELMAPKLSSCIGFEITETSFIHNHNVALANLKRFASFGIGISIDDYGSGVSSLLYLKEFPATELKIDKLFVSELASCHRNPLIVRSTIDLAHALGMRVVAEGVDSLAAVALLRAMGCDLIQGFILSRALPMRDLEPFLASGAHLRVLESATATVDAPWAFWSRENPPATLRPTDVAL